MSSGFIVPSKNARCGECYADADHETARCSDCIEQMEKGTSEAMRAEYARGVQDTLERLSAPAAVERAAKAIDAYLPMTAGNYIVSEAAFRSAVAAALAATRTEPSDG